MDIKEIALKHSREYLTFKLGGRKWLDVAEIVCDDEIYAEIVDELAQQFEAIIASYKAELLKEVGEPFGHIGKDILGRWNLCLAGQGWKDETAIYTADQLIAATKPLEGEIERLKSEQTELIDRFQNENCGRVHMGEPVISQSIKETVRQWLDILQEEAAQYKDELAMALRCSADLRSQLAAAQELIAVLRKDAETYGPEKISLQKQAWLEADRQRQINDLKDQLAKAEQRVAEACAAYITSGRYMILNPGESISSEQHIQSLKNHDIYQANAIRQGEWRKFVKEV